MNSIPSQLPNNGQLLPEGAFNPVQNGGLSKSACIQTRTLKISIPLWWYFKINLVPTNNYVSPTEIQVGPNIEMPDVPVYNLEVVPDPNIRRAYYAAGLPFGATVEEYGPYRDTDNCRWPEEEELLTSNFQWMKTIYDYGHAFYAYKALDHVKTHMDNFIVKTVRRRRSGLLMAHDKNAKRLGTWDEYKQIGNLDNLFATANYHVKFKLDLVCHKMCNDQYMQEGKMAYIYQVTSSDQELTDMNPDEGGAYQD